MREITLYNFEQIKVGLDRLDYHRHCFVQILSKSKQQIFRPMDDYGMYSTYARTFRAVEKSMNQYGITRPLTIEYKSFLNNLPKTPERQKDEILRQINCSKFPKSVHEVAHKLSDLYVCSAMARSLESAPIALAIKKSLKALENEFPPPGKRQVTTVTTTTTKDSPQRKLSKVLEVEERIRKDLQRYSQIGEIKKKLYSMPDYIRTRDRKGVKLPETKLKSPSLHLNLNISKVKELKTKMGRGIIRQEAKQKKIEHLKQMLNPFGKELK